METESDNPARRPQTGRFCHPLPASAKSDRLSCVQLLGIEGRKIYIGKNDLLDGTPILDIKPYLVYADAFPLSRQGWIEAGNEYQLQWSPLALEQAKFIEIHTNIPLIDTVALRLRDNPFPFKNHRIRKVDNGYELAIKTWRVHYTIKETVVEIHTISTGYDQETLEGRKTSRWSDVPIHQQYLKQFPW